MPQRSNSARYLWGDRNPVTRNILYEADAIAPHAATVRATYTVPAARKAQVYGAFCQLDIQGAAGTPADRFVTCRVIANAITTRLLQASLYLNANVAGMFDKAVIGMSHLLLTGESVHILTRDGSITGTVEYLAGIGITEYDS